MIRELFLFFKSNLPSNIGCTCILHTTKHDKVGKCQKCIVQAFKLDGIIN